MLLWFYPVHPDSEVEMPLFTLMLHALAQDLLAPLQLPDHQRTHISVTSTRAVSPSPVVTAMFIWPAGQGRRSSASALLW